VIIALSELHASHGTEVNISPVLKNITREGIE